MKFVFLRTPFLTEQLRWLLLKIQWHYDLFLNLEKNKAVQGTIKKRETENEEIGDPIKMNMELDSFFETFFKKNM